LLNQMTDGTATPDRAGDAQHAARSGAMQVLTILVQSMIFLTQIVFVRLYGKALVGAYQWVLAYVEVAARGGAAGAPAAMLRYVAAARVARDEQGVRRALGTGLRLCLAVGGAVSLVLAFGGGALLPRLDPGQALALRLLAPVPVLWGCLWVLIQASLAARVTRANFWVRGVFEPAALLTAGVIAWALGGRLRGLALAQSLAAVATLAAAALAVRRVFRPAERHRVLLAPRLAGFARFSIPLGLADFLNAVLQRADLIIVGSFLGESAVAVYGAAELITRVVANIRYAFDSIVAGMMSESLQLGEGERLRYTLRLTTRWVMTVAAPIAAAIIVLRHDLLEGLYDDPSFATGAGALLVLALSHFANASLGLTGWALVAGGRSRLSLLNNVVGVLFNIGAGVLLTPRYGIVGTSFAVLGTVLVTQGAALVEVAVWQRIHPFSWALVKPLVSAALALGCMTAVHLVIPVRWLRVSAVIAAGLAAYLGALLALGLPAEEQQLVERALTRVRRHGPG
jgi:O-antigen/teichoic acid export membrane protein